MKTVRLPLFVTALMLASLAMLPAAFAAPAQWESMDLTVHDEGTSSVLLVTGTLPEGTKLPAEVELTVPTGGKLQWAGEILGGDPSADPAVTPKVTTEGDVDVYRFTLTKAPIGQIEIVGPQFFTYTTAGGTGTLAWTPVGDLKKVRLSVRLPMGASVTTMTPGAQVLKGPEGADYVDRVIDDAKADEELLLAMNFNPKPVAPTAPASGSDATLPLVIILLVAAFGGVLLIAAISRKAKNRNGAQAYASDDDEAPAKPSKATGTTAKSDVEEEPATPKRNNAALIITAAVIVVAVAGGMVASQSSSSVAELPNGFVQEYKQGDACTSVTYALLEKPSKGDAKKLFDSLKSANALRAVAYTDSPRIEIGFCDSESTKDAMKAALAPTGLIGEEIPMQQPSTP
jgi:hypothetical protein